MDTATPTTLPLSSALASNDLNPLEEELQSGGVAHNEPSPAHRTRQQKGPLPWNALGEIFPTYITEVELVDWMRGRTFRPIWMEYLEK
jgi:hypothetical protein